MPSPAPAPRWLAFVPVFFDNAEVKGHELLHLAKSDNCVPSDENWVNYLLNESPDELGGPVTRNTSRLGVSRSSIDQYKYTPNKSASAGGYRSRRAVIDDATPARVGAEEAAAPRGWVAARRLIAAPPAPAAGAVTPRTATGGVTGGGHSSSPSSSASSSSS
jgi:hypothetical protein